MKKTLGIAVALMCLFINVQAQKKNVDKVVAVVGSNIILLSELNQQYAIYLNQGNPADDRIKCMYLQQMLIQKLLKQQAEIDSIVVEDAQVDDELDKRMRYQIKRMGGQEQLEQFLHKSALQYKDEMRPDVKEGLIAQKMQAKITENISVTPLEVKKYFDSYQKDSLPDIGTEVEVGEIVLYPKLTKAEKQKSYDKLEAMRIRIKEGEDFGFLAKSYSEDPGSASEGGDYGFIDRTTMVKEFTAWAFKLKAGEMSPVFETEYGYHLLQVLERRGETAHVRHILVKPQTTPESLTRLKLKADSIYKDIAVNKMPFAFAASNYSDNKETQYNGGMMLYADDVTARTTFIPVDKLDPSVFVVIDTMKVGEVSQPVAFSSPEQGKEGYKIFFLKSKIPPHKGNLEQDYPKFKERAQKEKEDRVVSEWFQKRKETTYIKVDEEFATCDEMKLWAKNENK
ncbi:peptidylprolyl isomerase [Pedobacter insulae]|uniref:Periplasmic chaperone for outer membrane proteins SurA n=1 Tax=Pedobacter insulae TaxID=414048 RepID=A0A1I2ZTZ8_9SPHI|nr:peptidylprolyl isomerase [Pedobacter insulae]SFH40561.1 periplasmic chaperone for outer membrane proteins SurA [Pedobacter insulae]